MALWGSFIWGRTAWGNPNYPQVLIGGVDKTYYLAHDGLKISSALNERSTAYIDLTDKNGEFRPNVGDPVQVYSGGSLIFGGTVDDLPEVRLSGTTCVQYRNVPIADYNQIADRILVAESYESQTVGYIVNHIITNYLASEGITAGTVQTGVTISKAVFNYITAAECFDEISELTGYQWKINANKTLDFFSRTTYSGTAITESSAVRDVTIKRSRENYRNRQYVRAGNDIATAQTLSFKGDGETQTFTVSLPIAKVPTITVNSISKTVGIRGVDTGYDWYWNKSDKIISQDTGASALTSSDTLAVTYQGYYPIMVVSDDPVEIASRASIEGGAGLYESIADKSSIDTQEAALEYSAGLLRRYANILKTVTLESDTAYSVGQLVSVSFPTHGINESMLVSNVDISTRGTAENMQLVYNVKLVSGESFGGWVSFFKKMAAGGTSFSIRENEVLIKLLVFSDLFVLPVMSDTMSHTLHQYQICGTSTICSTGLII